MVTGKQLSLEGVRLVTRIDPKTGERIKIDYDDHDCQDFMELIFQNCGQRMRYDGSNDMYRNACVWIGTLSEAEKLGRVVPGVALFIHAFDGGEPTKYREDGKGNASHVGMYVGENALTDVDKKGRNRVCNVVHSSKSMDRVAGSTLKNGWTHVGLWKNVDYGFGVVNDEDKELENSENGDENMATIAVEYAVVNTANGAPVNFRTKKSTKSDLVPRVPEIPNGARVKVRSMGNDWCAISYNGYDGYVLNEFLRFEDSTTGEAIDNTVVEIEKQDASIGSVDEKAKLYRVYVDFTDRNDALAFQKAMQGCQIGSVK